MQVLHFTGNVTREPELRNLNGKQLLELSVAASVPLRKNGEWTDDTAFLTLSFWEEQAQRVAARNIAKGDFIDGYGILMPRPYIGNDGAARVNLGIRNPTFELRRKQPRVNGVNGSVSANGASSSASSAGSASSDEVEVAGDEPPRPIRSAARKGAAKQGFNTLGTLGDEDRSASTPNNDW